jgi:leucyl aminopeptidase
MTVTLHTSKSSPAQTSADALIIGVIQSPDGPKAAAGSEDIATVLDLDPVLAALGATGKAEEISKVAATGRLQAPLVVAVGLGSGEKLTAEALRRAAGAGVREVVSSHGSFSKKEIVRIAVALPATEPSQAEAVALGALLGGYTFRRYRTTPAPAVELTVFTGHDVTRAEALAEAMILVRDLINTAPGDLAPADLADAAAQVATASGLGIQVLDESELAKEGYGGILAVGKGSARPPRLVRLEYTNPAATKTAVFVGKGITFDSGGLSLKPSKSMESMKSDMSGAAAVLGALQAVAALRVPVNVVGYLALAENMPGGSAQRPSDVITIFGGKTVEVLNTDAEGRLVMADALAASAADSPALLIDVATLTGAQTVALGNRTAGVMGTTTALAAAVVDSAERAGENMWAMPLPEELRKGLDSQVADIANVAPDRAGGMLVAGHFLREFVPDGVQWAHIDIAGPAFNESSAYGYTPKGGTGSAVRTLVQLAEDVANGTLP